jgi:hypothetical protein
MERLARQPASLVVMSPRDRFSLHLTIGLPPFLVRCEIRLSEQMTNAVRG